MLLCWPASFLTFGKVNPGPPQSAFVLAPASFLTLGRSTPAPLRLTFFFLRGRVPPHPPPFIFVSARPPPLRLTFFWEEREGFKSQSYFILGVNKTSNTEHHVPDAG